MPYITFPANLTEEEEILKEKFALLRKKKKQLQALKAAKQEAQQKPQETAVKRPAESAGEATEQAKKLVQSGAIKVGVGSKEKMGFKRSKHMEKKLKDTEKLPSVGFQPFSPQHGDEQDKDKPESPLPKKKGLYESFVPSMTKYEPEGRRDREREEMRRDRDDRRDRDPPKKGNTVYVNGQGVTEEMLRSAFTPYGKIINVNMERERNNGFITFEKMESADQAIAELNGSIVSGIQLKVMMARRQPIFENMHDPSTASWSAIAANQSQKGPSRKEDRDVLTYDEDDIF